jgi:outer membrane lipoprotein carrier protein
VFYKPLLFIILLFFAGPSFAQSRSFDCQKPLALDSSILKKIQAEYAKVTSFEAEFDQDSYVSALDMSETSSGKVWFVTPGRMRWNYERPEEQVFIFKDATVWLYQKVDNQVVIQDVPQLLVSDLPVSFMIGLGDLARDFTLSSLCASSDGIAAALKPKKSAGESEPLESLTLLLPEGGYFPKGAKIVQNGGNATAIMFRKMRYNTEVPASTFEATFPKEADIIDKRVKQP